VAALDHVGVERALGQVGGALDAQGFALERLDELPSDNFALLLRVGDAAQGADELLGGVVGAQVDAEVVAECALDQLALVLA
jgi:hypothetical protein